MLSEISDHAILKKARAVATESDHPLSMFFHVLSSQRRYRIKCKTSRYSRSFVPLAIIMLNAKWVILLSTGWIVLVVDTSGIHLHFVVTIPYILDVIMSCTMHILFKDNTVKLKLMRGNRLMIIIKSITRYRHLLRWHKPHACKAFFYLLSYILFLVTYLQWFSQITT